MNKFICTMLVSIWIITGFQVVAQEAKPTDEKRPIILDRAPVRMIQDPYPTFNGIGMDLEKGEVILSDDNVGSLRVYASQFEPTDRVMEPRREVKGPKTHLGYTCQLTISPDAKEIYTVDNDWKDNMCAFPLDAKGEVAPSRELNVDHGAWGIFLDQKNDELFMTIEHINKLSVYPRAAQGDKEPSRFIQGPNTGLADPHGVFVDAENNDVFVANHGHWHKEETGDNAGTLFFGNRARSTRTGGGYGRLRPLGVSTGKFLPPSITVYSRTAQGDATPLRTIQGSKTKLNWPLGIYRDTISGQLGVVNSGDNSVLFFDKKANGNVAPVRVIKGPATGMDGPSGIFIDTKRNELWVTNWNNHTATVYPRTAEGDVAPLRIIRGAPKDTPVTGFGNPGDIAYDPKRKQILVPN